MTDSAVSTPPRVERFRGYLLLLARAQLNPRLAGKLDASDVVQQTLAQAWQAAEQFRGTTDAEMAGWLRQILGHTLANLARDYGRERRDVGREQSLAATIAQSSARLDAWLADPRSSPDERAERNEQVLALADALAALPEPQGEALTLHHLHGYRLEEIAERMGKSASAVAGLLKRGLKTLRERMTPSSRA
jgi:RNA polymerase sigma-70 factor (ECF subfamily)